MEITELFLEKYKELESVISLVYGEEFDGAAVSWLERKKEFRDINSELKCCRETRNLLQHNVKISGEYAVVPNRSMIRFIRRAYSQNRKSDDVRGYRGSV